MRTQKASRVVAFSRLELVVCLAVITVLFVILLPLLAQTQPRSQLAICMNNLRQIGRGMLNWDTDHGAADPWRVAASDGTRNHPSGLQNNIWFQFLWLSNELRTPRILACPSDAKAVVATDFTLSSPSGLATANMRNNAISYFLGVDSRPDAPQSVLSGDRHARLGSATGSCSSGINPVFQIDPKTTEWNQTNLHGSVGQILFHDGRVELRSSAGLRQALDPGLIDDNGAIHLMSPRAN